MASEEARKGNARRQARYRWRREAEDAQAEAALQRLVEVLPSPLVERHGLDLLLLGSGRTSHGALRDAAKAWGHASAWDEKVSRLYEEDGWDWR